MTQRDPVKVVFVTPVWDKPRTGPEVYAKYLWEAFRDDPDIEFHLVAAGVGEAHSRLHLAPVPSGSLALVRDVAHRALSLMASLGTRGVLHVNNSNFHSSLLDSPWPTVGQINDYEAAQFGGNALAVLRQYGPRRFLAMWRRSYLERRFVRRQDVSLCNSEFTRRTVEEAYGMQGDSRLQVIYKAVDVGGFSRPSGTRDMREANALPIILFVGSDFRRKGLDVLVRALPALCRPARLRAAGVTRQEFDQAHPGLLPLAEAAGSTIDFLGVVDRATIPKLLWGADVFCMPSRAEALGVALLEAVAAGLPCVASDVGGIPEIARHFDSVRLVQSEDTTALSNALSQALSEPRPAADLEKISRLFGRDTMTTAVKHLYLGLSR